MFFKQQNTRLTREKMTDSIHSRLTLKILFEQFIFKNQLSFLQKKTKSPLFKMPIEFSEKIIIITHWHCIFCLKFLRLTNWLISQTKTNSTNKYLPRKQEIFTSTFPLHFDSSWQILLFVVDNDLMLLFFV